MSKRWGIALMIVAAGLLLANPNIRAADEANSENYEKIVDIKIKALEDRFDDYKWFGAIIIALLTGLGYVLIKQMVKERINEVVERLKPEERIQKRVDELYKTIESHKGDIDKLKQKAERELQRKLEEIKNIRPAEMTPEQKEIVKEAVEEIEKKPEEEYSAKDYYMLALDAFKGENFEGAIKYGEKAIKLDPNNYWGYLMLGFSYFYNGQHDQAIETYQKAIQQDPNSWEAYNNLASAYSFKKDQANALKYLELAIDKGLDNIKPIEQDSDLDFIRDAPEYRRIIEKLKAKK